MKRVFVLVVIFGLTACTSGPGSTPMEQDGLVILEKPHAAKVLFTMDNLSAPPPELIPVFEEYKKTPLYLHIVWRTASAPATKDLAQFSGRKVKQFWDPKGLTPSTRGNLLVNGRIVEMELLSLRLALARAAAWPE